MPRTTHEHEQMERLDREDREREQEAYDQKKAQGDEDTLYDLPVSEPEPKAEEERPDADPDDLKCERVQTRSGQQDCEEN